MIVDASAVLAILKQERGAREFSRERGAHRRLHDLDGDFHRGGEGDDPPIICDVCGRAV